MSDDQQHVAQIRHAAAIERAKGSYTHADRLEKAADRLEFLTRAKEVPEGSVEVKAAIAINECGDYWAYGGSEHSDSDLISEVEDQIVGLRKIFWLTGRVIPPKELYYPTIQAEVVEVQP